MRSNEEGDSGLQESIELTSQLEKSLRKILESRNDCRTALKSSHAKQNRSPGKQETRQYLMNELERLTEMSKELSSYNEHLRLQIIHYKQQNQVLKKELGDYKKYTQFLQKYNFDLKKEMVVWMRKPVKMEAENIFINRKEIVDQLIALRRNHELKEQELEALRRTMNQDQISETFHTHQNSTQKNQSREKTEKQSSNRSMSYSAKCNPCTSCNYSSLISKRKPMTMRVSDIVIKPQSKKAKRSSNLCQCHKKYIESATFVL